jgi:hypothetical protein
MKSEVSLPCSQKPSNYSYPEQYKSPPVTLKSNLLLFSYRQLHSGRFKASVCHRSLAKVAGSNPAGGMDIRARVVWCQAEVSELGLSLTHRSPTVCGVSEYDRKAKIMRKSWTTRGCCAIARTATAPVFLTLRPLTEISENSSTQFGQFIEFTLSFRNTLPTRWQHLLSN